MSDVSLALMLDAVPQIADELDMPRSLVRMKVAQGEIQGTCSACGEGRYSDYTCRDGGKTIWSVIE